MRHSMREKPTSEKQRSTFEALPDANFSHNDLETVPSIDHAAEARLVKKLDQHIVPAVVLLYLFSFLDRINIGNARLYGMEKDLGLTGSDYQIAVSLVFVTYIICELPSNLVLKKLRPSRWIAFITTSWGIVATLTGLVQNFAGLIVVRLVLGALEAGLFPGLTVYLTIFYTKREIALRVGFLFVSAALAGSVGGLLAYGIGFMDHLDGERAWRWIFIIEGLPSFVLGILTYFWLADDPETAYYLSPEERNLVALRKRRQMGYTVSADSLHKEDVFAALKDWKVWVFSCGQFCIDTMLYGYSSEHAFITALSSWLYAIIADFCSCSAFLPTIIAGLGKWSTAETQALTIPCYAVGAISYLSVAWLSDRQQLRGIYAVIFCGVSVVGYAILISDVAPGVHYFACFLVAAGLYVDVGIPLAWLPSNNPRYGKRITASGMQLTIGNAAGIMAPFLYKTSEGPRYIRGHAVTMGLVALGGCLYGMMSVYLSFRNKRRARGEEDDKITGKSPDAVAELGDENPAFIFTV